MLEPGVVRVSRPLDPRLPGAMLDYDEFYHLVPALSGPSGHPRFLHLGWVLGGEFCLYYFGATVINEVADNFFVVPTTTVRGGWKCKALSIVLELFQLGTLFPAAAFVHGECIRYAASPPSPAASQRATRRGPRPCGAFPNAALP